MATDAATDLRAKFLAIRKKLDAWKKEQGGQYDQGAIDEIEQELKEGENALSAKNMRGAESALDVIEALMIANLGISID